MVMQNQGPSDKATIESASVRKNVQLFFHYDFAMGTWSAKAGRGPPHCDGEDGWTIIWMVLLENGWRGTTRRKTDVANLTRLRALARRWRAAYSLRWILAFLGSHVCESN
jgi:hypothetical protein